MDSDHDGLITADELSTMFGHIGGSTMPDEDRIRAEFEAQAPPPPPPPHPLRPLTSSLCCAMRLVQHTVLLRF